MLQTISLLRPLAFEYRVSNSLDGATTAPAVQLPPARDAPLTEGQFIRQDVTNLGLIDLTGGGPSGQFAGRIVKWIEILGPNLPTSTDSVGVAFDGTQQRTELSIPALANGIFGSVCLFIPQTAKLRLNGMSGSPGNPVVVRIQVWQPPTLTELAEMLSTCCCRAECENQFGDPCFIQAIYSEMLGERAITSVNPGVLARGSTTVVAVEGTNLQDEDRVSITQTQSILAGFPRTSERSDLVIQNVEVIGNTANVTVYVPVAAPLGMYDVSLAPELGPQWASTSTGAIEVTA